MSRAHRIGLIALGIALLIAFHLQSIFNLTADEAASGRKVLLIVSTYVALGFPFSIFGGIVNGFQRNYSNGIVAVITSVIAAIVNVTVLIAGYGIVEMVAATTAVRISTGFRVSDRSSSAHILVDDLPKSRSTKNPITEFQKFSATQVMLTRKAMTAKYAMKLRFPCARVATRTDEAPSIDAVVKAATKRRRIVYSPTNLTSAASARFTFLAGWIGAGRAFWVWAPAMDPEAVAAAAEGAALAIILAILP